ncbi:MAG: hypothetical protein ABGY09_00810 [Euryarchaeota archaeon]
MDLLPVLTRPTVLVALSGCVTAIIIAAIAARVYSRRLHVRELELKVEREKVELVRADLERRRLLDLLFYLPEDTRLLNRVSAIRSLLTSLAEKYMDVETRMTRLELEAELKRLEKLSKSLEKLEEEGGK